MFADSGRSVPMDPFELWLADGLAIEPPPAALERIDRRVRRRFLAHPDRPPPSVRSADGGRPGARGGARRDGRRGRTARAVLRTRPGPGLAPRGRPRPTAGDGGHQWRCSGDARPRLRRRERGGRLRQLGQHRGQRAARVLRGATRSWTATAASTRASTLEAHPTTRSRRRCSCSTRPSHGCPARAISP